MKPLLALTLLACAALPAQQTPAPTELAPSPFFIKHTWFIGGTGNWDYLTMDPQSSRLFITHGPAVQVVDTDTGTLAGQITGFRNVHSIALDDSGDFGFASDGPANQVDVFDLQAFKIVARIPTGPSPRAVVYEPQTRLVFAVSANPLPRNAVPSRQAVQTVKSSVTVIDAHRRTVMGSILLPGKLGFAATDGAGQLYVVLEDRDEIASIDATYIKARLHGSPGAANIIDWSALPRSAQSSGNHVRFFLLGTECSDPNALAVDSAHMRLFAACGNLTMVVLNASTGEQIASLPTGAGDQAIGYDPNRGLIYTANGDAMGSLTVIHQDITDTYAVIYTLPTRPRARTLAVNPANGDVYLVTDYQGMNLAKPGGIGTLKIHPVNGSFQVLVIAH